MNYTLLQSTIASRLNRKDLGSQIQTWIYNARRNIVAGTLPIVASSGFAYHRFSWAYTTDTLSTVASASTVDIPDAYIDEIDLFYASGNKPLVKSTIQDMNNSFYANNDSTDTGVPTNYAILATQLKLYPIPDGVYDLTLYYYGYPDTLVNGSDEKTIDKLCPDLIIDLCCYEGGSWLHDNNLQIQFGEASKNRYYNLVTTDKRRQMTNTDMRMKTYHDMDINLYKGRQMQ